MFNAFFRDRRKTKFLDRINSSLPVVKDLWVGLASTTDDFLDAARLVDLSYRRRDSTFKSPNGLRVTPQILAPTTTVIVAKVAGRVVATLTVIQQNPFGFPVAEIMSDRERAIYLFARERTTVELAGLAIEQNYVSPKTNLFYSLIGYALKFLREYITPGRIVFATQPNASEFYQFLFGFELIGDVASKSFPSAFGEQSVAMEGNISKIESTLGQNAARFPKLSTLIKTVMTENHREVIFQMPDRKRADGHYQEKSVGMIEEIYLNQTALMRQFDVSQRARVQAMYPDTDGYRWVFQTDPRISQRKARRFPINSKTVIAARADGAGTSFRNGTIVDLSEFGALLKLDPGEMQLPTRGEITISMRVPTGAEATMHGEVVHSRLAEELYGIKFTDCNPEFHSHILNLTRNTA